MSTFFVFLSFFLSFFLSSILVFFFFFLSGEKRVLRELVELQGGFLRNGIMRYHSIENRWGE